MRKLRYVTQLRHVSPLRRLPAAARRRLEAVERAYAFRSNEYYQSLIDWDDARDPIRRIVIPHERELHPWGELDASNESAYAAAPGLEHKYPDTALLLVNDVCGGFCRFCFRKRLFMEGNREVARDVSPGLAYIRSRPEIRNVLLTGGDPLLLSGRRLLDIVGRVAAIPHVRTIRIGSKLLAFNPFRVLSDPELVDGLSGYSTPDRRIYLMAHFNHPRELTDAARQAVARLQEAGIVVMNQTPLVRGLNDDPQVLGRLFDEVSALGVAPYYVFQCRPTQGNLEYAVPVERGYRVFVEAQRGRSGLSRRARFVMSHATGKVEVVGWTAREIAFRYHRAADPADEGRLFVRPRNPRAYWLDDYGAPCAAEEPEAEEASAGAGQGGGALRDRQRRPGTHWSQ
ncbi:MAG: KamA family radical SAM protein [Deferrisomatales bacterium]